MTEDEFTADGDLDSRLRAAMSEVAPDAPATGVIGDIERRAVRRKRRVRESVAAGLVVVAGGGVALGFGLSSGSQGTFAGPVATTTTSTTSSTSTQGLPGATAAQSDGMGPGLHAGSAPPTPPPCKTNQRTPTTATGRFCGPAPGAGNGSGPDGACSGTETTPPCGPGVVPGRYYAYTMPGTCSGLITFDGKQWVSELPPPTVEPDSYVWMNLGANGTLGWISPNGAVGFEPYVGQTLKSCS
jgi:hypothetical protein